MNQTSEILQNATVIAAALSVLVAVFTFIRGSVEYRRTQTWLQLRFAAEVVEKIYANECLKLAMRFLDWHDRDIFLPQEFSHYANKDGVFAHKVENMRIAMNSDNRAFDETTKLWDLTKDFRKLEYMIYVEVFDQFFDYVSQLHIFIAADLIKGEHVTPVVYILRRMDKLKIFAGYIERYHLEEVKSLMSRFESEEPLLWVEESATAK